MRLPLLAALAALAACHPARLPELTVPAPQPGAATLQPFQGEAELEEYTRALALQLRRYEARLRRLPPPPPPAPAAPGSAEQVTSVQHAGVDEGGIVKVHGDHLVVLRRGRLFTVRIGGGALEPVAAVDAFAPGVDPARSWYDEMLVSGDNVVVIGYSYQRGGTELGVFRIGADGSLAHRATYHLRSADYYSARNYASRLVGDRLVLYAPVPVRSDVSASLPAIRRWGDDAGWVPTAAPRRLYRSAAPLSVQSGITLHTVTVCDVGGGELACEASGFFGPAGREFYVSPGAVYVWAADVSRSRRRLRERSTVYRLPLDGSAPTGLGVAGRPVDQFSFLESADGFLNVLTRPDSATWEAAGRDAPRDRLALLRLPLASLGDGSGAAPAGAYRLVPAPAPGSLQNRFVGGWLLYGSGSWGGTSSDPRSAYAVRWAERGEPSELRLPHGVDRIEALGGDALLVGADSEGLGFVGVRLDGAAARVADRFALPGASQAERRSQGFFYRPDREREGLLALPIRTFERSAGAPYGSVSVAFLRNRALRLDPAGELAARPSPVDDACRASCVDWYGNARPIFLRGRILALMGYELVEGEMQGGAVRELRRVSFAPRAGRAGISGEWAFSERIGTRESGFLCDSRGTMRFDQQGEAVGMTYRQTGECLIEGATTRGESEGSGAGTLRGRELVLEVGECVYRGTLVDAARIEGTMECTVELPGGARVVSGRWEARAGA